MSGDVVRALLTDAADASLASAVALERHGARAWEDTVERAAVGGLAACCVGWAFACGYEAALARLDPEATRDGSLAALCATEEGGGHPRAIRTTLTPSSGRYALTGRKAWVTLGAEAAVLLVACDQPALTASHLDRIVASWAQGARAVGSRYSGTLGVPALFDRSLFPSLLALRGDAGAKKLLHGGETAAVDWADGAHDVDTPGDLDRAAER